MAQQQEGNENITETKTDFLAKYDLGMEKAVLEWISGENNKHLWLKINIEYLKIKFLSKVDITSLGFSFSA